LAAALDLFGHEHGRNTRIEDVIAKAGISRGTFYNYFTGIEPLLEALSEELTRDFDAAVHTAFRVINTPVERTAAAIRYYLHGALHDPRWGWAMINSSVGRTLFSESVVRHVHDTIQEGIDCGDFRIDSVDVARDILLGTSVSATITLLHGGASADYPEKIAHHILLSFGVTPRKAAAAAQQPISELPRLTTNSQFFRGALGGNSLFNAR
jgi:AcrR family transcriptional regulator